MKTSLVIVSVIFDEEESTYAHGLKIAIEKMLERDGVEGGVKVSRMKVPG